jgi:hypothetical protein
VVRADVAEDLVADGELRHPRADGRDHARDVEAGHEPGSSTEPAYGLVSTGLRHAPDFSVITPGVGPMAR